MSDRALEVEETGFLVRGLDNLGDFAIRRAPSLGELVTLGDRSADRIPLLVEDRCIFQSSD